MRVFLVFNFVVTLYNLLVRLNTWVFKSRQCAGLGGHVFKLEKQHAIFGYISENEVSVSAKRQVHQQGFGLECSF